MRGAAGFIVLALAALLLGGCGGDPRDVVVSRWTLVTESGQRDIELPTHVTDLVPVREPRFALRARVPVPSELRDRSLTLSMDDLLALANLRVNGRDAVEIDTSSFDRYRTDGFHRWRIDADATRTGTLDLELTIEHTWVLSGWLDAPATLGSAPEGPPMFAFAKAFDRVTEVAGLAVTLLVSVTYGLLFIIDRRRTVHAWHGIQGILGSAYPVLYLGVAQPLLGRGEVPAVAVLISLSAVASMEFVAGIFELPKPSRIWWLLVGFAVASALASVRDPFHAATYEVPATLAAVLAASGYGLTALVRGRGHSLLAGLAALGFPITAALALGDSIWVMGLGDPFGGVRGGSFAIGAVSLMQAAALSRDHVRSMNRADSLNSELASRVALLEASNAEIRSLAEELRHQIGARSQKLGEALARLGPMPSVVRAFAQGDVIDGRYHVVRRIGEGGMGTVYEVQRATDSRRFALKILQGARSGGDLARLAREAEIAARIDHPNVVGIVDVGVSDSGAVFYVMELVDGASLDELDARYGNASWAIEILAQIAEALAALHACGIIHRDLKPGNVLVTRAHTGDRDLAKIADFGISTRVGSNDATTAPRDDVAEAPTMDAEDATEQQLTRTGQVLGTPLYMAPELARGAKHATAASDVYALGVIAVELATGAVPRALPGGERAYPSLSERLPGLDRTVAALLDRCLAPDPLGRPTAREIADAIADAIVRGSVEPARDIPAA